MLDDIKPVALDAADQALLRDLNDKTAGIQRMMVMFTESGERRFADLQKQGRELFEGFATKYGLDFKHVAYQPSPDGKSLVPTTISLVRSNESN